MADDVTTRRRTFVLEDTKNRDYRHIRAGLLRRGWQQVAFPRRQASEEGDYHKQGSSKFDLCWVQRRGAMGVASVGLKVAPCPDLIWTLSHGRLPASGGLGPGQITNFFDRTSCLTTKAGLCRTLQNSRRWGSEKGEGFDSPSSFFPRCFDLSDMSQVDEFKDDFRQTAAEAVLKVFRRFLRSDQRLAYSTTNATQSARKTDEFSTTLSHHPILAEQRGSDVGGWFDNVHSWVLALALRACRRRLLELAGWRDDHVGAWCTASGAERLKPPEWDSLLFYSYILRRAVQPLSDAATPAHPGNRKPAQPLDRSCVAGVDPRIPACKSDKPEEDTANRENRFSSSVDCANDDARDNGLHPAGVGLRGLQGLRCLPPTEKNGRTGKTGRLSRRPSSAPARRQREKVASVEGRCLSPGRGQTTATESVFTGGTGDSGRRTPHAAPGVWGAEECNELWHGLSKIWGPSGCARSQGCARPWDACEGGDGTDYCSGGEIGREGEGAGHGSLSQLMEETAQICVALEKKCPQWKMDGESNLWMLKPAGASRGQGVRLAWTMDQILYAQKTMGGRVIQKYIESPMLIRRRQPAPTPPMEPVPTEWTPTQPLTPETKPQPSEATPRQHPHQQRDHHLDKSPAPGSRRRTMKPQRGRTIETSKTGVMGGVNRTIPCPSHLGVENGPKPPGGAAAAPLSLTVSGLDERNPGFSRSREPRDVNIDIGPPSAGATKFDVRVWVLVKGWKPLEAFWFDECYLRVCPERFTLDEANFGNPDVHLTNLYARRPVGRALKISAPSRDPAHGRRRKRTRPSSASRIKLRCATSTQHGHYDRTHVGVPADNSAQVQLRKHQEDETGALRAGFHVDGGGSECFVASQADLIDSLGEMDAGGGGWPPGVAGGLERETQRERGERLWKSKVSPSIRRIIKSSLLAANSHVRPRTASFQLFGFDVLLDRELRPWLLEVNMSPALSHTSKRQSSMIRAMCEGLLRVTVDRIFPPPQPWSSSADEETPSLNGPETVTEENGHESKRTSAGNLPHYQRGRWRSLTVPPRPPSRSGQKGSSSVSISTRVAQTLDGRVMPVNTCVANPSSQNFTVRGRHLSRRGLVRAERGIREATAVKMLEDWWGSKIEGCRRLRSRKSWADAVIRRWMVRLVTRRRQRALLAETDRLARLRQRQWRRLSDRILENRRMVAFGEACILVQTTWRARRLERLRRSKGLRSKVAGGLRGWARALHSRRRKKAAEIALGAASTATKLQQKRKISAAEIIVRTLKTAGNRRRQNLLPQQRPASALGLFPPVPVAQVLGRADLVRRRAATTIQIVLRKVVARSAIGAIRTASVRTLQKWFRTVLRKWERRRASAVIVQRVWRRAKQRKAYSVRRMHPNVINNGLLNVSQSAVVEDAQSRAVAANLRGINLSVCQAKHGSTAGVQPQEGDVHPHARGRETDGENAGSGHVISGCALASTSVCSSHHITSSTVRYSMDSFGADDSLCAESSSVSADGLLSQATTAHENWVPAPNQVERDVESCSGKDSGEENGSDEARRTKEDTATTAAVSHRSREKTSSHRTRNWNRTDARVAITSSCNIRKAVEQTKIARAEDNQPTAGILSLDRILCDIVDNTRSKPATRKSAKRYDQSEVHCPRPASSGRPMAMWGSKPRRLDGGSTNAPRSAVGGKPIDSSRAPGRQVRLSAARAQPSVATSPASRSCDRPHCRCQGSNYLECAPLTRGVRAPVICALGMGLESAGRRDAHTEKTCCEKKTRVLAGGGKRAGIKTKNRKGVPCSGGGNSNRSRNRVPRPGDGTRLACGVDYSSTFCTGESGAVLQMLASLEG